MTEPDKLLCGECHKKLLAQDALKAPHPFIDGGSISGCPRCREAETLSSVCDEPGCWSLATCGNPSPDGYRNTCYEHQP